MDTIHEGRRNFLKTSAAGATGLMVAGLPVGQASASSGGAWTDGMQVNPNIDNLRVVCAFDPNLAGSPVNVVEADMDKMAMALAQKPTAAEAWATIFRKPASKQWSEVKVAIKAPGSEATVNKLCKVLNSLGIPLGNITYFDSNTTLCMVWFVPMAGVKVSMGANTTTGQYVNTLHGLTPTAVPYPAGSTAQWNCTTDIANGTIDILITMGTNRGHSDTLGSCTLCCKSLYGVFNAVDVGDPLHGYSGGAHDGITGLLALQKSPAILGGTPPRQQLVFMDSIQAGSTQNGNDFQTNRLIMGTFAPMVDYLTIMKIRKAIMSITPKAGVAERFYRDFGYTDAQVANINFIDALSYVPSSAGPSVRSQESTRLQMVVSNRYFKLSTVDFELPFEGHLVVSVSIFDPKGRLVREFSQRRESGSMLVSWDGKAQSGMRVPSGTYAIKVTSGGISKTGSIMLAPR